MIPLNSAALRQSMLIQGECISFLAEALYSFQYNQYACCKAVSAEPCQCCFHVQVMQTLAMKDIQGCF